MWLPAVDGKGWSAPSLEEPTPRIKLAVLMINMPNIPTGQPDSWWKNRGELGSSTVEYIIMLTTESSPEHEKNAVKRRAAASWAGIVRLIQRRGRTGGIQKMAG